MNIRTTLRPSERSARPTPMKISSPPGIIAHSCSAANTRPWRKSCRNCSEKPAKASPISAFWPRASLMKNRNRPPMSTGRATIKTTIPMYGMAPPTIMAIHTIAVVNTLIPKLSITSCQARPITSPTANVRPSRTTRAYSSSGSAVAPVWGHPARRAGGARLAPAGRRAGCRGRYRRRRPEARLRVRSGGRGRWRDRGRRRRDRRGRRRDHWRRWRGGPRPGLPQRLPVGHAGLPHQRVLGHHARRDEPIERGVVDGPLSFVAERVIPGHGGIPSGRRATASARCRAGSRHRACRVRAVAELEPVVVARELQRCGHRLVGERPVAELVVEVVRAILQEHADRLLVRLADQARVDDSRRGCW